MYVVKVGDNTTSTHNRRTEATKAARKLSRKRHLPVRVLRDEGIERLVYRRGRLEEGAYITPEQRRRVARFT